MDKTYGLVIYDENKNTHTISGEPFTNFAVNKYQILRSTYFSIYWLPNLKYIVYLVKYNIPRKNYLIHAHQCLENNFWQSQIVATFYLDYTRSQRINNIVSTNSQWSLDFNEINSIISLPYIHKLIE